jgi:hypothetical protein
MGLPIVLARFAAALVDIEVCSLEAAAPLKQLHVELAGSGSACVLC